MNVRETKLPGVVVFEPAAYRDDRGYLTEVWNQKRYEQAGLGVGFACQDGACGPPRVGTSEG